MLSSNTFLNNLLTMAQVVREDLEGETDSHFWSEEYNLEQLALAARAYVRQIEESDIKPVGW